MLFEELTHEEDLELARTDGDNRITELYKLLKSGNRLDEFEHAIEVDEFRQKLFEEFGL